MNLSDHLTIEEFLATSHRQYVDENHAPPEAVLANARRFAVDLFEPARNLVGPLHVTSGYRCPELNAEVGGSPTSAHVLGLASDLVPLSMTLLDAYVRLAQSALPFDQLIWEYGRWIHLGAGTHDAVLAPRRSLLMKFSGSGYEPWSLNDLRLKGA